MLISEIVTEILKECGCDTSDSDLQTKIFGFIKSTLRRFPRHTRSRFLLTTKSVSLSSGSYSTSLPSGFIRERAIYYIEDGNRRDVEKLSFDDFNEEFNSSSTSKPEGYRIIGSTIEFTHKADKDYTIYIECLQEIDNVALTDTFIGDSSVVEILKDGAKYYYYDYVEDTVNKSEKLALFNIGLQKLEADYLADEIPAHIQES